MTEEEAAHLPITKFRNYIRQCFNITSLKLGGEFEFQSEKDLQRDLDCEVDELIREGVIDA